MSGSAAPPSYSERNPLPELEAHSELPAYTGRSPPTLRRQSSESPKEFTYELTRKSKAWATLTLQADDRLSKTIPTFVEGSNIAGTVKLQLPEDGDAIQTVTVSLRGLIISGANSGEQFTFLDMTSTLWSQAMGNPNDPPSDSTPEKYTKKLYGEFTWPYSIPIPKETTVPAGPRDEMQVFRLPQTFLERHTRASIQYEILLRIGRNKLRTDHKLTATFGYIPMTRPPAPSMLRQLAYQENSLLMGPHIDPDGWHDLPNVKISGKIFNNRSVDVDCTLSLAKPLSYTRGSVIPLVLRLETKDLQALDLLAVPKVIAVRLRRTVKYNVNGERTVDTFGWKDEVEHSQLAVWWPSLEAAEDSSLCTRTVNGELHLKIDMKPTSAMAHFRVEYTLVLFPFDAIAFESADTEPLALQSVEITTAYAPGPRPRTYAPPGYDISPADVPEQHYRPSARFL
ncbi:hypothetical protein BDQ12DRAFT_680492 [Crucibulum laeve]|uniref:Arrestin-like N-terminal domain-containing protein n=1 Tax=Crucibulum laeve TaxID=68775 RepID=A0A5C3M4J1_9AGAR|nr:hypothetical protein BDQ12DRAFT_680492 [Crucibulum laeve]